MKKILFSTVLLLLSSAVEAQNLPLPETVGKHLFEMMANRADIAKSPAYTDLGSYTALYKKGWTPYLQEEMKSADEAEKMFLQGDLDNLDGKAEALYTENLKNSWPVLLQYMDQYNINARTATYNKTFFKLSKDQDAEYMPDAFDLYISMNYKEEVYAFEASVQWADNQWVLITVEPNIYRYTQMEDDELVFEPESNTEQIPDDATYKYNTAYQPTDIEKALTIESPAAFNQKIVSLLTQGAAFGTDNSFLTENEYMETSGNVMIKQLREKKERGEVDEEFLNEISSYLENPSLLFETELKNSWGELQENMKEEFEENDLSRLSPSNTDIEISNGDRKFKDLNNITLRTDIKFQHKEHQAGIIFEAIWYKGMWKLTYIQPFPYDILEMMTEDTDSDDFDDTLDAIEAVESDED
ncbi:hypothetical protein D0T84_11855 [Dysgonomonas sp. 521]|uniref:hypothetical protein n=1 Tax=Dysgonomonas sp. 521 TaxID=2302932 RepID=UPI0013CFC876|nr:hypothetical protein [Dysgonomonas sp. 521]NDV95600.1 hypothetical protein [Dysgonomonas sp. 521]